MGWRIPGGSAGILRTGVSCPADAFMSGILRWRMQVRAAVGANPMKLFEGLIGIVDQTVRI
jgi:hypothetical protein